MQEVPTLMTPRNWVKVNAIKVAEAITEKDVDQAPSALLVSSEWNQRELWISATINVFQARVANTIPTSQYTRLQLKVITSNHLIEKILDHQRLTSSQTTTTSAESGKEDNILELTYTSRHLQTRNGWDATRITIDRLFWFLARIAITPKLRSSAEMGHICTKDRDLEWKIHTIQMTIASVTTIKASTAGEQADALAMATICNW